MNNQELSFVDFLYNMHYPTHVVVKYRNFIKVYAATLCVLPENAAKKDILRYINKIVNKGKLAQNGISSFLTAFDLFYNKYHDRNIPINLKDSKNSDTKIPEFLIYPELLLFFSKTKNDIFQKIFALMYLLGLKPCEVINIELIHYNEKDRSISITNKKGKPMRILKIPMPIFILFKKDKVGNTNLKWLFEVEFQKKLNIKLLERHFNIIFKKTHILKKVTLQVFRNSYIEHQIESGMDKKILLSLLGVNNLRYLSHYRQLALKNINTIRVFTDGADLLDNNR